jgi:hypothetical protein
MQSFAFDVGGSVGIEVGVATGVALDVWAGTMTVIPMEADEVPADAAAGAKTNARAAAAMVIFLLRFVMVILFLSCVRQIEKLGPS